MSEKDGLQTEGTDFISEFMYNINATNRLIPEKAASHCSVVALFPEKNTREVFVKKCRIENCEKNARPNRTVCGMHHMRFCKYASYDLPEKPILNEGVLKLCKIHGELNSDEVKIRCSNGKQVAIQYYCRKCDKIKRDKYKQKNNDKINAYRKKEYRKNAAERSLKHLLRTHLLTLEEYLEMQHIQNNLCAICNQPEKRKHQNGKIRRLSVDHCEETGKTRALLCSDCNMGIGLLCHNPNLLLMAAEYICAWKEKHAEY